MARFSCDRHIRIVDDLHRGPERPGGMEQMVEIKFLSVLWWVMAISFEKRHGSKMSGKLPATGPVRAPVGGPI